VHDQKHGVLRRSWRDGNELTSTWFSSTFNIGIAQIDENLANKS
jgi:hypothetical protein